MLKKIIFCFRIQPSDQVPFLVSLILIHIALQQGSTFSIRTDVYPNTDIVKMEFIIHVEGYDIHGNRGYTLYDQFGLFIILLLSI